MYVDATADVALFTVSQGELGIVLERQDDEKVLLPSRRLDTSIPLANAAVQEVGNVVSHAETVPPLEPYAWQVSAEYDPSDLRLRVGHAAVAGALNFPAGGRYTVANPQSLLATSESSHQLTPEETVIVQAAISSLRQAIELHARHPTVASENTGPIVARLLPDPHCFTMAELRTVFEVTSGVELDKRTFDRNVRAILPGIIDTGDKTLTNGRGKPATVYSMSAEQYAIPALRRQPSSS